MEEASNRTMLEMGIIETTLLLSDNILNRVDILIYPYENNEAKNWDLKTV
jgi:hypothetical protein